MAGGGWPYPPPQAGYSAHTWMTNAIGDNSVIEYLLLSMLNKIINSLSYTYKLLVNEMIEIPEIEATGRVAEIYDDIRTTLDMSMVNTIWRNLALNEEVLEWVWYSLKPIYQNGSIRHYASKLRCQINLDDVSPIPLSAFRI